MARILIIEDDVTYARVIARTLEGVGHTAEVAANGPDGLARALDAPPDLLLLDVIMPEMDGYAVAQAVKASPATAMVPIIFITGATDTHHKVTGLEAGANDYITKPFQRTELLARVGVALRIGRLEDSLRRQNQELAELARTDPLTGLPNRRVFEERLEEEWARIHRYDRALSLLMLDVDHFREVNDALLHAGGDEVLCAIAQCLRAHMRSNDLVARVGGEEFTILCPETTLDGATALAERIRAAVEVIHDAGGSQRPVTVSIGVAMGRPGTVASAADLVAAADTALRQAKHDGRNRVVAATLPADTAG